ncbi:hypothetical protein [Runella sp.]
MRVYPHVGESNAKDAKTERGENASIFLSFTHTTLCLNQDLQDLWICRT